MHALHMGVGWPRLATCCQGVSTVQEHADELRVWAVRVRQSCAQICWCGQGVESVKPQESRGLQRANAALATPCSQFVTNS